MEWFKENWLIVLSILVVVVGVIVAFVVTNALNKKSGQKSSTRDLTFGAVCIAASFALSFFGYELPQGGTITPASVLPIMLYCHYSGFKKSLPVCLAFTLLQFMQKPYILHPFQVILDYFIPYLALIFVSVIPFNREKYSLLKAENKSTMPSHAGLFIGAALYIVVRYTSHVLSGAIFFSEYAWEGWGAWGYSFVYNLFSVADVAIAVAVGAALLANKAFDTFMASSFNGKNKADGSAKNDQGTAA